MIPFFTKRSILYSLLFAFESLLAVNCLAQKSEFRFPALQNISTKEGLSNNQAFVMMQDSRGFIWVATSYGLNRYDGYNFKVYNYDSEDTNSIRPSWYYSLFEDKNGIIWVSSTAQGFFSFDPAKEKFTHYMHHPGNSNSLADNINESNMVADSSGMIWICTAGGLNSFDPLKKKFELFTHNENDITSLSSNNIYWICIDDSSNIWATTSANTLDVFNINTKKVTVHYAIGSSQMPGNKNKPAFNTVTKGEHGNIWICSENNGLYNFNIKTKKWNHFFHEPGNNFSLRDNGISDCYEDNSGDLLISPKGYGLDFYEAASGKFFYNAIAENNMAEARIFSIVKDKSGKVWMACVNNGIFTYNPQLKNIKVVRNTHQDKNSMKSDFVVGFYHSPQNDLFVTGQYGVYTFDKASNTIKPFEIFEKGEDIFNDTWTWMVRSDNRGMLWFCTRSGLISYDIKTKAHHYYQHIENDSTSLSAFSATGFLLDKVGRYWVCTFGGGLESYNPETRKFRAVKISDGNSSVTSHIGGMFKDSKGILYLGTWDGGLIRFNPDDESYIIYCHNPSDASSISCNITWPLYEDTHGIIWVGTVGGGLNAFDPSSGKFRKFTMKDGLPSNAVVSLVTDDDGNTWLGTYHGISRCILPQNPFDINCKINFRNYDVSDGLPSNDLYFSGAHKEPDGTLFFSTNNGGFFYFNPRELNDNNFVPPVYITGFSLMNKEMSENDSGSVLNKAIEYTKEIHLNYKQNILAFTFSALNFIHPEKNKYAYMLDGYDKEWIYNDASRRFVTYTNLDPGEYIFKVKGSNNDGIWNTQPTELSIRITPPFWQTAWFKLLIALTVAGAAYSFYRYRVGHILLLQKIRNKIAADLHDDIGSTLNSISIYSDVAVKDPAKRDLALKMIGESSRKIIDSMSDIVWTINPQNDNFEKIIFRISSMTHSLLKAKKIDCVFKSDESLNELSLPMETRRNFYLIFKEALNNLVKYSNATRATVLFSYNNKMVTFIIRDNGNGFDSTASFNGNGLQNMRRRATEIKAQLNIESAVGNGTSIELNLKV